MKQVRLRPRLGLLFVFAVVLPGIALSVLAVRAISREEAYIEKRMEEALLAEVAHVASLVEGQLDQILSELQATSDVSLRTDYRRSLSRWERSVDLVDLPFLVSPSYELIWPDSVNKLDHDAAAFLEWNRSFLGNEQRIPVYENVALSYRNGLLEAAQLQDQDWGESQTADKNDYVSQGPQTATTQSQSPNFLSNTFSQAQGRFQTQYAIEDLKQSEPARQEVYKKAREKGKQIIYRTVKVSKGAQMKEGAPEQEESIFVSESLRFSQIIARGDSGIIPLFFSDDLHLMFWKKIEDNYIVGCVIDNDRLEDEIVEVLPAIYSSARILTILDEKGNPLITPAAEAIRNWRQPFVAREISQMLPRWEVAAYLSDPDIVSSRAQIISLILWILILMLFFSIVAGGTLVLRSLHSEMALARQKTTFVTNVSHELKTPLTSIRMFAEILRDKRQPDEAKQNKYLALMVSETERLTRLINNVLDFSRRERGEKKYTMREVDLASLCEAVIDDQRVRLESNGFELTYVSSLGSAMVYADEESIKQALLNLINNAEKYSPDEKKIECEIRRQEGEVVINIKDRGKGVAEACAKKIFKEFYRADDSLTSPVRGTGLGLSIAQKIIRDHGGDIVYVPREGGGSIFQIRLPLREASSD